MIKFSFLKSVWKDGFFDTPFAIFEEKTFSSLRRENAWSWEHKGQKYRSTVYKQVLDFHSPFTILCHTRNYEIWSKSLVPTMKVAISTLWRLTESRLWTQIKCHREEKVWRHNWLYTWCRAEGWGRWRLGWSWICSAAGGSALRPRTALQQSPAGSQEDQTEPFILEIRWDQQLAELEQRIFPIYFMIISLCAM